MTPADKSGLTVDLVQQLIAEQLPHWRLLPVRHVDVDGNDNTSFRLGEDLVVRLPTHDRYIGQVDKEATWLPRLAPLLPLPIPEVVARCEPSETFPRPWTVRRWIPGAIAGRARPADPVLFAASLAEFLDALQAAPTAGGPLPGPHSCDRGGPVSRWDDDVHRYVDLLADEPWLDRSLARDCWSAAVEADGHAGPPVWVHGDIWPNNLLLDRYGGLAAVIDFGCSAVGDPACDLSITWAYLDGDARQAFRNRVHADDALWARGRGWALWGALYVLSWARDTDPELAHDRRRLATAVLDEHRTLAR